MVAATYKCVSKVNAQAFVPGQLVAFDYTKWVGRYPFYGGEKTTPRQGVVDAVHDNRITLRVFDEESDSEFKSFSYSKMSNVVLPTYNG